MCGTVFDAVYSESATTQCKCISSLLMLWGGGTISFSKHMPTAGLPWLSSKATRTVYDPMVEQSHESHKVQLVLRMLSSRYRCHTGAWPNTHLASNRWVLQLVVHHLP